ncbi:MAG TPA: hypothetical protein VE644_09815 [Gaiellaceae bacterium]|nr:hypothetical protein [Gaiellaceae bacterium]
MGSIVVVPSTPSAPPAPPDLPALPALPPASDAQRLGFEPAATKSMALAEGSSLVFVDGQSESPQPAALKTIKVPSHPSSSAPTPSGVAGGSGAASAGGSSGLLALLFALLILGPPLLSRVLSLSVELMRPTALVLQLKRPG